MENAAEPYLAVLLNNGMIEILYEIWLVFNNHYINVLVKFKLFYLKRADL